MKPLLILVAVILAIVAFIAFGLATVRRESEVAMHFVSDEEFVRNRIIFFTVGTVAAVLELLVLSRLARRRAT